jgi:N-6 DNA Methylase
LPLEHIYDCLQKFDFATLFTSDLGWNQPATKRFIAIDNVYTRHEIARIGDLPVFEVSAAHGNLPDTQACIALYWELMALFPRKLLLIFINKDRSQSLWFWVKSKGRQQYENACFYIKGQPEDIFLHTLLRILTDLEVIKSMPELADLTQLATNHAMPGEITEYLCRQTIHRLILKRICKTASNDLHEAYDFTSLEAMLLRLDAYLCHKLLFDILPDLSVLDPACRDGIFLLAATNTLRNIYGAIIGKIAQLNDDRLTDWLQTIYTVYSDLSYYVAKKIITDNIFGVDRSPEAVQTTRANLLAALSSSVRPVDKQEQVSEIHFNIYTGDSLIGVLNTEEPVLEELESLKPFHWAYMFRRILRERGGFDIIITDPPWRVLKSSDLATNFLRLDTQYEYQDMGPLNLYTLFIERNYRLLQNDGECGMVVPGGIYNDFNTQRIRKMLLEKTGVTSFFAFENFLHILPDLHRNFKFALLTFEKGNATEEILAAFNRHDVEELVYFPAADSLHIPTSLIRRLSPDICAIAEFRSTIDMQICEKIARYPFLVEKIDDRWNMVLTQDIHMSSDRQLLHTTAAPGYLPLYEGSTIQQFALRPGELRYWVKEEDGRAAILRRRPTKNTRLSYQDYRLGYRSIARSTDQRTLVATVLPPDGFAGNTLNVTDNTFTAQDLLFLLALLNSFVVDFMLRLRVSTHVSMHSIYQLPVPRLTKDDAVFYPIARRAARLVCVTPAFEHLWKRAMHTPWSLASVATTFADRARTRAELDGLVAHLYDLTETQFTYLLATFSLVPEPIRVTTHNAYRDVERGLVK